MSGNLVSITLHREPLDCPQCGRAWHLKRGLCVACLLACGLDGEMHDGQTLDDELDQIHVSDADGRTVIIKSGKKSDTSCLKIS